MKETRFKDTEIGMIPEDWVVTTIGDVISVFDGTHQTPNYVPVGIPFYSVENVSANNFSNTKYISPREHSFLTRKVKINKGDVLMTRIGSIGVCKYIDWDIDASFYVSLSLLKAKSKDISMKWFAAMSASDNFKNEILLNSLLFAVPMKINLGEISKVKFCLPSLEEQSRIASALTSIDNLISSLDKLIEKKKNIKQGTMQQLLTGKKRLKGFTEPWVEKKVEDVVVRFATGLNPRQNFVLNSGGHNYYVTIKNFHDGKVYLDEECDRVDNEALRLINNRSDLRKGDLLLSSIGRVGDPCVVKEEPTNWNINESVFTLRPNPKYITVDFLYYVFKSDSMQKKLSDSSTGSTLTSIKMGHLKELTLKIAPTIPEQNAIANVLTSMDSEISALEGKKAKYESIKQGMMQQLLTGKIRLI